MTTARRSFFLTEELHAYLLDHCSPVDDVQSWLIRTTYERTGGSAGMQIAPEQGALMTVLTRVLGVRRAVEVGTFTGYSALCIARGLPADGRLTCCDISEEWTSIGREAWDRDGVGDRIEVRIGDALTTLRSLPLDDPFDLAFLDADKATYHDYYRELIPRMRSNGVVLVDNTLWDGAVLDASASDDGTEHIRRFNDMVAGDGRVESTILTIGDGLTLIRVR